MAEFNTGIYEIVNTINGKRYVGSAVTIRGRFNVHRMLLRRGRHHSPKLQRSWDKHGEASFVFRKLLVCSRENLVMYEQIAMDALKPEYNILLVAGSALGHKWNAAQREAARVRNTTRNPFKGRKHSPETLALMSAVKVGKPSPIKGRPRSQEAVEKTAASHRGRRRSDETRAKIAAKAHGRKRSAESVEKGASKLRGVRVDPSKVAHLIGNKHSVGRRHSEEWKATVGEKSRAMWSDPVRRAEILAKQSQARARKKASSS